MPTLSVLFLNYSEKYKKRFVRAVRRVYFVGALRYFLGMCICRQRAVWLDNFLVRAETETKRKRKGKKKITLSCLDKDMKPKNAFCVKW